MELNEMIDGMTAEVYQRLVTAVETGKWADGVALTPEQRAQPAAGATLAGEK